MDTGIPLFLSEIEYLLLETIPLETIMRVLEIEMVPSLVVVYVACLSNPALRPLYSVRKPSFLTTPINTDIEVGFCPPVKKPTSHAYRLWGESS